MFLYLKNGKFIYTVHYGHRYKTLSSILVTLNSLLVTHYYLSLKKFQTIIEIS